MNCIFDAEKASFTNLFGTMKRIANVPFARPRPPKHPVSVGFSHYSRPYHNRFRKPFVFLTWDGTNSKALRGHCSLELKREAMCISCTRTVCHRMKTPSRYPIMEELFVQQFRRTILWGVSSTQRKVEQWGNKLLKTF